MTILDTSSIGAVPAGTPRVVDPSAGAEWAKAYCGPAHGHTWLRDGRSPWPPRIVLASHAGPQEYRLVQDLRTHRPARDRLGNIIYMPVPPRPDWCGLSTTA